MKTLALIAVIVGAAALMGCTKNTPPAQSQTQTTSGIVCPAGYELAKDGTCVRLPEQEFDVP